MSLGGLYLEGLVHEGAYFWNFTVGLLECIVVTITTLHYFSLS